LLFRRRTSPVRPRQIKTASLKVRLGIADLAATGYLRVMNLNRTNLWLAAAAALFLTASCSQAPDAEKEPSADAAYKRAHRAEMYREAQRSNVTR